MYKFCIAGLRTAVIFYNTQWTLSTNGAFTPKEKSGHRDVVFSCLASISPLALKKLRGIQGWVSQASRANECLLWESRTKTINQRLHFQWDWFTDRTYKLRIRDRWLLPHDLWNKESKNAVRKKARWKGCKMKEKVLAPIHILLWDLATYWESMRLFCILIINLFLLNLVQIFFYYQFVFTNYIWLNLLVRRFKTNTQFCGKQTAIRIWAHIIQWC